jgi:large subunit ribosomal protein L28
VSSFAKNFCGGATTHHEGEFRVRSRCDLCGKGTAFGHNVSHSHRKTNRRWLANIQKATIVVGGYPRKMHVCTRCMRTAQKQTGSQA